MGKQFRTLEGRILPPSEMPETMPADVQRACSLAEFARLRRKQERIRGPRAHRLLESRLPEPVPPGEFEPCARPELFTAAMVESAGAERIAGLLDAIYYGQVDAERHQAWKRAGRLARA